MLNSIFAFLIFLLVGYSGGSNDLVKPCSIQDSSSCFANPTASVDVLDASQKCAAPCDYDASECQKKSDCSKDDCSKEKCHKKSDCSKDGCSKEDCSKKECPKSDKCTEPCKDNGCGGKKTGNSGCGGGGNGGKCRG